MNRKILIIIGIVFLGVSFATFAFFNNGGTVLGVVSPIAEDWEREHAFSRYQFSKEPTASYPYNTYFPTSQEPRWQIDVPIDAKAYAVMERKSGELLLAHNLYSELPIASVAKIMTAICTLEHADLDVELTVSQYAADIGEAEMGLTVGEKVSVENLLYGIMLPSGNDAAETLAEGLAGGRNEFIRAMNAKARDLALWKSYFVNPTGLDEDTPYTSNVSSALDLLALTNYALNNKTFADMAATYEKIIPYREGKHKAFFLYNILQLDRSYPGIKGVKPGITEFAGETLVSYAENGGKEIIVVLLGTQNSRDEVVKVYDFVFKQLGINVGRQITS